MVTDVGAASAIAATADPLASKDSPLHSAHQFAVRPLDIMLLGWIPKSDLRSDSGRFLTNGMKEDDSSSDAEIHETCWPSSHWATFTRDQSFTFSSLRIASNSVEYCCCCLCYPEFSWWNCWLLLDLRVDLSSLQGLWTDVCWWMLLSPIWIHVPCLPIRTFFSTLFLAEASSVSLAFSAHRE